MTTDDLKETLRKEPKTEYELCRFFAIKQGKTLKEFFEDWRISAKCGFDHLEK